MAQFVELVFVLIRHSCRFQNIESKDEKGKSSSRKKNGEMHPGKKTKKECNSTRVWCVKRL